MRKKNTPTKSTEFSTHATLPRGSLKILQVTDPHIYADPNERLLGLNTLDSFDRVLRLALQHWPFDIIVATGDLSHDGSAQAYQRLCQRFAKLEIPTYCLPGNHDRPRVMKRYLRGAHVRMSDGVQYGQWSLVFLDSTVPDEEGGYLSDDELARLQQCLSDHPHQHTLICLHHHPVPIGSAWMDNMALDNSKQFFKIIDRHPQVRGILWGHIHQVFEDQRKSVKLLGSPSTCIQFLPGQQYFAVDTLPPGFRWLTLLPTGELRTGIERLNAYPSQIDLTSAGY